jgi:hypothetical protein
MIAAIEWVPAGVSKELPLKYELNPTEKYDIEAKQKEGPTTMMKTKKKSSKSLQQHNLPADLRMDDYSDDDDDDDDNPGAAIGNLLVREDEHSDDDDDGDDDQHEGEIDALPLQDEQLEILDDKEMKQQDSSNDEQSDDDDDDDDDDNLQDVPDTREFMPLDFQGLESMGIGGDAGLPMAMPLENYLDDDSEADDVRIMETDAVIVVAKTEEVGHDIPWLRAACFIKSTFLPAIVALSCTYMALNNRLCSSLLFN